MKSIQKHLVLFKLYRQVRQLKRANRADLHLDLLLEVTEVLTETLKAAEIAKRAQSRPRW